MLTAPEPVTELATTAAELVLSAPRPVLALFLSEFLAALAAAEVLATSTVTLTPEPREVAVR